MCTTCGCGGGEHGAQILTVGTKNSSNQFQSFKPVRENQPEHKHTHHGHHHTADHNPLNEHIVELEKNILHQNQLGAERNRGFFEALHIFAINLVSSPGSGKTSLLERTISDLKNDVAFSVIEGDQQTTNDADRIAKLNVPVIQINTGKGCHLDSEMVSKAVKELKPVQNSILMIENVGNLVCPAMFDLGEAERVVIISTTEGEDKPLKYPDMFDGSQICIINKTDLLPYLQFDLEKLKQCALQVNPNLKFFELSATSGEGLDNWYAYLKTKI